MIEREELAAWLRLLQTPGVGRTSARRLLACFGSPQGVLRASIAARRQVVPAAQAEALAEPPPGLDALLQATLAWLGAAPGRQVLTLGDAAYPPRLLATADPPLLLHAAGRLELLAAPSIALVGSRSPTRQGLDHARAFAAHLSRAGHTVVSGLALGIDGAAHEGALEGPGSTIAVIGTGPDRVYPQRHRALAERIAAQGLLLSEYPVGTPPLPDNFPRRNRIISGLSLGTLVVEAALQSGSLITARLALEQGREVFALPGSLHSPQSRGCHALIKQGAKLVETAEDILEELHPPVAAATPRPRARPPAPSAPPPLLVAATAAPGDDDEDPLLAALGWEPVTLDALSARTGWAPAELNARLLTLELEGRVARLPGQLFQRVARA